MSEIRINNQDLSAEDAEKLIDSGKKITQASLSFTNCNKVPTAPSHDGITIDKEFMAYFSSYMSECEAQSAVTSLEGIPKLYNRNLYLALANADVEVHVVTIEPGESRLKKMISRFLLKLLK